MFTLLLCTYLWLAGVGIREPDRTLLSLKCIPNAKTTERIPIFSSCTNGSFSDVITQGNPEALGVIILSQVFNISWPGRINQLLPWSTPPINVVSPEYQTDPQYNAALNPQYSKSEWRNYIIAKGA